MSDDKLNRIEDKIDGLVDKVHDIDKTLVRNTASLEEHIRRTAMLESSQAVMHKELAPLRKHIAFVNSSIKLLAVLTAILGTIKIVLSLL